MKTLEAEEHAEAVDLNEIGNYRLFG